MHFNGKKSHHFDGGLFKNCVGCKLKSFMKRKIIVERVAWQHLATCVATAWQHPRLVKNPNVYSNIYFDHTVDNKSA